MAKHASESKHKMEYNDKHFPLLRSNIEDNGIIRPSMNNLYEYLDTEEEENGLNDSRNESFRARKLNALN
jgi:hypothetical protein